MESFPLGKKTQVYLDQLSTSLSEKQEVIFNFIKDQKIPQIDGKYRILEIGTGDGSTFKLLREELALKEISNVEYWGVDIVDDFAKKALKNGVQTVVADIGRLSFESETFSAINASAIFHELYTYGTCDDSKKRIYGVEALKIGIKECTRVLKENGVLVYRDVFTPEDTISKRVRYSSAATTKFMQWWLPLFQNKITGNNSRLFRSLTLQLENGFLEVLATPQLQREIQRHYLTFRDLVRRVYFREFGLQIQEESWVNVESGIKSHSLSLNHHAAQLLQMPDSVTLNSQDYDKLTDEIINKYWSEIIDSIGAEWLDREGTEEYAVISLKELLSLCIETTDGLLQTETDSVQILPRSYYSRYLYEICDFPEEDGKQCVVFRKSLKKHE